MKSKKLLVVILFLIYLLGITLFEVYMRKAGRADPIIYSKNVSSKNEGYIVKVSQYFYRPKLPFEKTEVRLSVEREENKEIILDELPPHTRDFSRELGGIFLDFTFIYCIISIWIKAFI